MRGRFGRMAFFVMVGLAVASALPFTWTRLAASGPVYEESEAPQAEVVLVLGAQVLPDGQPTRYLKGRLDTAGQLLRDGKAKVALVSGDAQGGSGDETTAMTAYLTGTLGIETNRVVTDPYGLDTYDSCLRAKEVYGITKALVVTQGYHLSRAVALCRSVGIDADGVAARCDDCVPINLARNAVRDYLACSKAAWDATWQRRPAVQSPPSAEVTHALSRS